MTQSHLAEEVGVDVTTVQGWESGRRPILAVSAGDLAALRSRMVRLGASPALFTVLNDAVEADLIIAEAVRSGSKIGESWHHSLSATVHRRDLTNLITWPLVATMPSQLCGLVQERQRRGPVAAYPILSAEERTRFFEHLRAIADRRRSDEHRLLRRQAIYLLAFTDEPSTRQWLADENLRAMRRADRADDVPSWVSARSSAVALARSGDRNPLSAFVASGLTTHVQEIANLNYWAYWVGEVADVQVSDDFMGDPAMPWQGARLLEYLTERLHTSAEQIELYVRTLWQLMLARPHVLDHRPRLRSRALERVSTAVECGGLAPRDRHELEQVAYAIRSNNR